MGGRSMADDVQVLIEPAGGGAEDLTVERVREVASGHARVAELLGDPPPGRLLVAGPELLGRQRDRFRATVFDPAANQTVELTGPVGEPERAEVRPSTVRPNPRPDELREALAVLRGDPRFAPLAGRDDVVVYAPMPPLADLEREDGTVLRRPTLGILDPSGSPRHRIVAVGRGGGAGAPGGGGGGGARADGPRGGPP